VKVGGDACTPVRGQGPPRRGRAGGDRLRPFWWLAGLAGGRLALAGEVPGRRRGGPAVASGDRRRRPRRSSSRTRACLHPCRGQLEGGCATETSAGVRALRLTYLPGRAGVGGFCGSSVWRAGRLAVRVRGSGPGSVVCRGARRPGAGAGVARTPSAARGAARSSGGGLSTGGGGVEGSGRRMRGSGKGCPAGSST
jgi:hypothetical protein